MRGLVDPAATLAAQHGERALRFTTARGGPALRAVAGSSGVAATAQADLPPLGEHVQRALRGAALLVGVPLAYLMPDPGLVPPESLQLFVVDPAWVRALQRGMLGAAAAVPLDDDELDALLEATVPAGDPLTGLLLASAVVERYPGLAVRAWTGTVGVDEDPDAAGATPVRLVRCERLTPGLLLVLFERPPDVVTIDEPPGMARLGLDAGAARLRGATGALVEQGGQAVRIAARWRGDPADGVLDVTGLGADLSAARKAAASGGPDPATSSAGWALQVLRPPVRQRYQRGVVR